MDYKCDLYCYRHCDGGWVTHVAGLRRTGEILPAPDVCLAGDDPDQWTRQYQAHIESVGASPLEPIGGPYDGEDFHDATLQDFKQTLLKLREAGYIFPDSVLEEVEAELCEEQQSG